MKFKNTFYSMHHTVLLSYHLVHSYPVLVETILLFYLIGLGLGLGCRRVARVPSMWKHFQAGGLGAALRPPMGPGQSPCGGPGGEAPGS